MVFVGGGGNMMRDQLDGPPWGTNVDPDEAYLRGQAGSTGSGLLGGVAQAWFGGAVETTRGPQAEVRRTIHELAHDRLSSPAQPDPDRDLDADED
jgi:hypothetical protein